MEAHELYDHVAQEAWQRVLDANQRAEEAWQDYDDALQAARLAEDAMWELRREAERLSRIARHQRVQGGAAVIVEAKNGSH